MVPVSLGENVNKQGVVCQGGSVDSAAGKGSKTDVKQMQGLLSGSLPSLELPVP